MATRLEAVQSAVKIKKIIDDQDRMAFHAAKVNWQSPEYRHESENLRKSDERSVKILVGLYDLLAKSNDLKKAASLEDSIDGLAIKISAKSSAKNIKDVAPRLIEAVTQSAKKQRKIKERDVGLDRE